VAEKLGFSSARQELCDISLHQAVQCELSRSLAAKRSSWVIFGRSQFDWDKLMRCEAHLAGRSPSMVRHAWRSPESTRQRQRLAHCIRCRSGVSTGTA